MTSIALNPGIPPHTAPSAHSNCCGHTHHHQEHSSLDKEHHVKQEEISEPGLLAGLWQRIKRWIWGDSETKVEKPSLPDLLNQQQPNLHEVHKATSGVSTRSDSPKLHQHSNHSLHQCSGPSCSISHKSISPSTSGHVHSGGCCGGSHSRVSSISPPKPTSSTRFSSTHHVTAPTKPEPPSSQAHNCSHNKGCSHNHDHDHDHDHDHSHDHNTSDSTVEPRLVQLELPANLTHHTSEESTATLPANPPVSSVEHPSVKEATSSEATTPEPTTAAPESTVAIIRTKPESEHK